MNIVHVSEMHKQCALFVQWWWGGGGVKTGVRKREQALILSFPCMFL